MARAVFVRAKSGANLRLDRRPLLLR